MDALMDRRGTWQRRRRRTTGRCPSTTPSLHPHPPKVHVPTFKQKVFIPLLPIHPKSQPSICNGRTIFSTNNGVGVLLYCLQFQDKRWRRLPPALLIRSPDTYRALEEPEYPVLAEIDGRHRRGPPLLHRQPRCVRSFHSTPHYIVDCLIWSMVLPKLSDTSTWENKYSSTRSSLLIYFLD